MDQTIEGIIEGYLKGPYDVETKNQIRKLQKEDPKQLEELFSGHMSFGTGGMRGLVGIGPNRMNVYTIREATLGLALYLKKCFPKKLLSVVIGYDSRKTSRMFAFEAARTLAQHGVSSFIFNEMRPLSLVSFGVRHLHADAGIMITASHNPPEYNGFKVYWNDGGQITSPHDTEIEKEINSIQGHGAVPASTALDPYIHVLNKEVDEAYLDALKQLQLYPATNKSDLKVVYTPLHGTGGMIVPLAMYQSGLTSLSFVKEQMVADGLFATTPSPNPETKEALSLGIVQMQKEGADILLANDPDADRLGVVIMHENKPFILTGNQIASLMIYGILQALSEQNAIPERMVVVETIVTTGLIKKIVESYGGSVEWVLTGFKYIAEKIREWEKQPDGPQFLFGCEESLGSLYGTFARDKDGVEACCLISEIGWKLKTEGKTLYDALEELWKKFGYFEETLVTSTFSDTQEGKNHMAKIMAALRSHPLHEISDYRVVAWEDLLQGSFSGEEKYRRGKGLPRSDVIIITLEDESRIIVRPSGTEPKVKMYLMLQEAVSEKNLSDVRAKVGEKMKAFSGAMRAMFR